MTSIVLIKTTTWGNASVTGATFGFNKTNEIFSTVKMPLRRPAGVEHVINVHNYQLIAETLILHSAFSVYTGTADVSTR